RPRRARRRARAATPSRRARAACAAAPRAPAPRRADRPRRARRGTGRARGPESISRGRGRGPGQGRGGAGGAAREGCGPMAGGALAGLRVLDLTTLLSAPQVAAMLADFGAEAVKIEPPEGDPLRRIGAARDGRSLPWALVARGKRAVTLDLDREEGRALFARLAARADVLVENLPTALLARWGCDYPTLARQNPRLVVVSVSCY